jgi:hypothetical protein
MPARLKTAPKDSTANLGFEAKLGFGDLIAINPFEQSGTGVSPVISGKHGRDAHATSREHPNFDLLGQIVKPSEARKFTQSLERSVNRSNPYSFPKTLIKKEISGGQFIGESNDHVGIQNFERGGVHQFGSRPRAMQTAPRCSTSSTISRPRAWPASSSPMAAFPPTSPVTFRAQRITKHG